MKIKELENGNVSICDIDEDLIPIIIIGLSDYIEDRLGEKFKEQRKKAQSLLDELDDFYSQGC